MANTNTNNEGMLVELAEDFKTRFAEKTKLINELKKFILMLYGIVRIAHEHEDIHFVEIARSELSRMLESHFGLDEEEDGEDFAYMASL